MKYIFLFLSSIILLNNCSSQNYQNSLIINYNAVTRGSQITISVTPFKLIYATNLKTKSIDLSKKRWGEIKVLVSKIELEKISNLKAPSTESYIDRALIGSITITKNEVIYESSTFDHGNPPLELKDLINKLFEIVNSD